MLNRIIIIFGILIGSVLAAWGASNTLSGLSSGTTITNNDLFYDVQSPGVGGVKVTGSQFLNYIFSNVSGNCQSTSNGVFTCSSNSTGTTGIAAGTNITTSGATSNVTINVVATPTFTSVTTTLASVSGWLTAPGVNMQTATIVGALAGSAANFTGTLMASVVQVATYLTASGASVQTLTIGGSVVSKVRSATATIASATSDYFLCLDPTAGIITLTLPGSPLTGLTYLVKDCTGQSATHNIIVTATNANIDGSATFALSTNYQSIGLTYNGTQWSVN